MAEYPSQEILLCKSRYCQFIGRKARNRVNLVCQAQMVGQLNSSKINILISLDHFMWLCSIGQNLGKREMDEWQTRGTYPHMNFWQYGAHSTSHKGTEAVGRVLFLALILLLTSKACFPAYSQYANQPTPFSKHAPDHPGIWLLLSKFSINRDHLYQSILLGRRKTAFLDFPETLPFELNGPWGARVLTSPLSHWLPPGSWFPSRAFLFIWVFLPLAVSSSCLFFSG